MKRFMARAHRRPPGPWVLLGLLIPLLGSPSSDYLSIKRKFDLIESDKLRPGSRVTIDGKMLDYLIQHYLIPQFPEAKVGQPFELAHHIDRLEVTPDAVGVVLGR